MPNDKTNPTDIESLYEAKATEDLEESVAEDLEVEDPADAEEVVAAFESEGGFSASVEAEAVEEEEEAVAEKPAPPESPSYADSRPKRHRGPKS